MRTLSRIAVHPIKALDPAEPERVGISEVGGLTGDRAYAIVDGDGEYVNGKRTDAVHRLRADYDLEENRVTLRHPDSASRRFHLEDDHGRLEAWLSDYFETEVSLEVGSGGELTDGAVYGDGSATGPTLISEATLRETASWFDGIDAEEMRLRLRPNLVVEGVPAFWEDRLIADGGLTVAVGDRRLVGTKPIPRCVVPTRDPHTGAPYDGFRETFTERREETLPEWAPREQFDHLFALMVGLRIPEGERNGELSVGDSVEIIDS